MLVQDGKARGRAGIRAWAAWLQSPSSHPLEHHGLLSYFYFSEPHFARVDTGRFTQPSPYPGTGKRGVPAALSSAYGGQARS